MKFEEKHVSLFKQISKIAVLVGLILWLVAGIVIFGVATAAGVFNLLARIFAILGIVAFILKMFLEKFDKILTLFVNFGGIGYVLLVAIARLAGGSNPAACITMIALTTALLVALILDAIKKKEMDFYQKFILGLWILMIGIFDINVGANVTLLGTAEFVLLLFLVILLVLRHYALLDEKTNELMMLLWWNLIFFTYAIGGTSWGIGLTPGLQALVIIADILVVVGAIVYIIMTYFKLKGMHSE